MHSPIPHPCKERPSLGSHTRKTSDLQRNNELFRECSQNLRLVIPCLSVFLLKHQFFKWLIGLLSWRRPAITTRFRFQCAKSTGQSAFSDWLLISFAFFSYVTFPQLFASKHSRSKRSVTLNCRAIFVKLRISQFRRVLTCKQRNSISKVQSWNVVLNFFVQVCKYNRGKEGLLT